MSFDINFIDSFIVSNSQYPDKMEDSDLWKSIKMGTESAGLPCTDEDAQKSMLTHCNSESFYALCKARGFIEFHYATWVEKLLRVRLINDKGRLGDKLSIARFFAFDDQFNGLKYIYDYKICMDAKGLDPNKGYNIKVYSNSGVGDHFMAGYVFNGKLFLSDSGKRGIRVEASKVIPKDKFQWILEV